MGRLGVLHVESDAGPSDKVDVRNEIRRLVALWGCGTDFRRNRFRTCSILTYVCGHPRNAPYLTLCDICDIDVTLGWGGRLGVVHVESDAGPSNKVHAAFVAFWWCAVLIFRFRICPLGQPSVAPTHPLASYLIRIDVRILLITTYS